MLTSCLPEQKVARTFIRSKSMISLMVTPPVMVYKFNHKGEAINGFDSLSTAAKDSALWNSSQYIQYVSDSIVLENFMNSFIDELRTLGFNIYLNSSADSFDFSGTQSYLVDISQFQMDEYLYPVEDEGEFFDSVYVKKVDLNTVDYSVWFDLYKAGSETNKPTTLYGTNSAYSAFEGHFFTDPFSGRIRYKYSIQDLELDELYKLAGTLGKKYAGYLFDFFMNQYIAKNLPPNEPITDYYHYNRRYNAVIPAYEDRLEVLKSK